MDECNDEMESALDGDMSLRERAAAAHAAGKMFLFPPAQVLSPRRKRDQAPEQEQPTRVEPADGQQPPKKKAKRGAAAVAAADGDVHIRCHKFLLTPDSAGHRFLKNMCHASAHVFSQCVVETRRRIKLMHESEEWAAARDAAPEIKKRKRQQLRGLRTQRRVKYRELKEKGLTRARIERQLKKFDSQMRKLKAEIAEMKNTRAEAELYKGAYVKFKVSEQSIMRFMLGERDGGRDDGLHILNPKCWIGNHLASKQVGAIVTEAFTACMVANKKGARVRPNLRALRPTPSGRFGAASGTIAVDKTGKMFYLQSMLGAMREQKRCADGAKAEKKGKPFRAIPIQTRGRNDKYEKDVIDSMWGGGMRSITVLPSEDNGVLRFYLIVAYVCSPKRDQAPRMEGRVGIDFGTQTTAFYSEAAGAHKIRHHTLDRHLDDQIRDLQRKIEHKKHCAGYVSGKKAPPGTPKIKWSNKLIALKRKKRSIEARQARARLQESNRTGKIMSRLGDEFVYEDCSMQNWSRAAGRGVRRGTPANLRDALRRNAESAGARIREIDTKKAKATQFDPVSRTYNKIPLEQRTVLVGGFEVDRDLKAAWNLLQVGPQDVIENDEAVTRRWSEASCGEAQGRFDPNQISVMTADDLERFIIAASRKPEE